jgi:glycosyltransferase involved in cell wall biosynthesis
LVFEAALKRSCGDKKTLKNDIMLRNTITVATSLAPFNIELQIKNIKTWKKLGMNIISVNSGKEIRTLTEYSDAVNFVEVHRDASNIAKKPFVYLDDVLQALKKTESQICGIINSDIFLSAEDSFLSFIIEKSRNAFVFGSRIDVDLLRSQDGEEYFGGFDYFFFDKLIINLYQKTDFCLGLPWWDFWLPLVPIINNVPVRRLITPFAYHVKHQQNWQQEFFEIFGRIVASYLRKENRSKSIDKRLQECLCHIDEPEIINFAKCILSYLKNIPEHIFYVKNDEINNSEIRNDNSDNSAKCDLLDYERTTNKGRDNPDYSSMGRMLKMAFFTSHPANVGSGSERLVYDTAKALIERGHDARVYVMNAHLDPEPPYYVHQMPRIPFERLFERGQAILTGWNDLMFPSTALLFLCRWLNNADIWHFHNLHGHYLSIPLLSLLSWRKCILISPVDKYLSTGYCPYPVDCDRFLTGCGKCQQLDDPWPGISRDATKTLWKIKRFVILHSRFNLLFHTQALAAHYEKTFVGCRPGRVIHYGIDINCFRKLDREGCHRKFALKTTSRFVIGLFHSYVSEPRKGIVPIIKKLGELGKLFPGRIELLVVGRGGDEIKNIVPPELSITILPYLHHPFELANALNLCDVLLYPTKAENLSLTCLYSLACGVPVISYDAGGQREAIKNGYNGFIVDIGDEERMIKNLIEMINNPLLCKQLSDGARSTAEKQFDFDNYIDDLIAYYGEII